jgi:hypothetical protein
MRVIKETVRNDVRISLFSWNNKYIIKFEQGGVEQTFKVDETEITAEKDLDSLFEGEFFESVKKRFNEMQKTLRNSLENI